MTVVVVAIRRLRWCSTWLGLSAIVAQLLKSSHARRGGRQKAGAQRAVEGHGSIVVTIVFVGVCTVYNRSIKKK